MQLFAEVERGERGAVPSRDSRHSGEASAVSFATLARALVGAGSVLRPSLCLEGHDRAFLFVLLNLPRDVIQKPPGRIPIGIPPGLSPGI